MKGGRARYRAEISELYIYEFIYDSNIVNHKAKNGAFEKVNRYVSSRTD